jgi:ribonuclease HI
MKGGHVAEPRRTAFAIQALTSNYVPAASASSVVRGITCEKPSHGTYKLNVDASFHPNGTGAAGAVLRDDRGDAIAGVACPLSHVHDATAAEALALLKGLVFLLDIGVTRVTVESDSLEVIQACKSEVEVWSPHSAILYDCFSKAQEFDFIDFTHCNREANNVAHELARYAFTSNSVVRWDESPPSFILPFVLKDVTMY